MLKVVIEFSDSLLICDYLTVMINIIHTNHKSRCDPDADASLSLRKIALPVLQYKEGGRRVTSKKKGGRRVTSKKININIFFCIIIMFSNSSFTLNN